jgi:hypothetical protein
MTAFRNCLITCGAALGANLVVFLLRWLILYPATGLGVAKGPQAVALAWASGAGVVTAVLAGVAAGVAVYSSRPTGWSLLLAGLVFFHSGTSISKDVFSTYSTHAAAEFAAAAIAAFVAFASFHVVHSRELKRQAHARAV